MIKNAFRRAWAWVYGRVGPRGLWIAFTALLALGALSAGMAWGTWTRICDQCPSIAQIYAFEPKEATRVYAADGGLLDVLAVERRTAIPYTALPRHVIDAFISVEDRRFWKHHGVDVRRSARAAAEFAFAGYNVAGGSTITQQLAGNMFTDVVNRQDISIRRKLREMRVAKALEDAYSKTEILEAYLNQINFDGVYGIQNAAQRYFGKDARNLNLPEAALLAGMPRAPARYSPIRHPERAVPRRNLVISLMEGQGRITEEEAASAMAYPLVLRDGTGDVAPAAFFVEWVRRILYDRYGAQIYEAGFKVYTTLDPGMQNVADSAYRAQLKWIENQPDFTQPTYRETREWSEEDLAGPDMPYVQGMFIAIDPRNGDVLAMIGGRDFLDSEFNRATQARRQPGSAFKPFTYTAAVAAGIPASEIFLDTPTEYPQPDGSVWSPRNFTGRFLGPISMREALTRSINVVAVKIGARIGVGSIAQFAHRMGIRTDVPVVPSTPIGAPSVRPIELAEAYTTFANLGVRTTPQPIQRIEGADGRLIWEATIQREEVLDERVAWIMLSMLRDVVDRGTGRRVRTLGVPASVPVAGKTGTTNEATNAWFVGFTPDVVTATWIGFDLPRPIRKNAQGGVDAAPINAEVLRWYYERNPHPPAWPRPAGITTRQVDRTTGLLPTQWCPADVTVTEVYIEGTEPTGYCDAHGPFSRGVVTDSLAADSTEAPVSDDFDF